MQLINIVLFLRHDVDIIGLYPVVFYQLSTYIQSQLADKEE